MKNKNEVPIPLELVKDIDRRFPMAYSLIEKMRKDSSLEREWNRDKCYIPVAATIPIIDKYAVEKNMDIDPTALAACAAWRQYKEIYHIDSDLASELYLQGDDMEYIPVSVLEILPYPCLYIELEDDDFKGFFVFWEQDFRLNSDTTEYELRFLTIGNPDGGLGVYHLHICEGGTLKESTERTAEYIKSGIRMIPGKRRIDDDFIDLIAEQQSEVVTRLLQLVLYICAENADIDENPEQKKITRKPSAGTSPKDVFREIRKWDVGVKIGAKIRHQKYEYSGDKGGNGSKKRPHVRRGHYHHFWAGSDKDGTRRLILRWIAPMFVNGEADDVIVTKNIVEKR